MSTATITRLESGGAVFELNSMTHWFPDWRAAAAEADAHGIPWEWAAATPHESVVAAVAPALRVLP
jgi:hypothetical protein